MWQLVFKDMALQGRSLYTYFVLAVLAGIFFFCFTTGGGEEIIYVVGVVAVINVTFRAAYEDDRNKGFSFLCSLPLKRSTVVWSKFTGSIIFVLFGFGAMAVIDLVFKTYTGQPEVFWARFPAYTMLPSGILILLGIFWLLFFKFGYIKASNIVRFLFLAPLLGAAVASQIIPGVDMSGLYGCLQSPLIFAAFFVLALLTYGVMLVLSLALFGRADLG